MKILHTADLHIREFGDKGWSALEELLNIGKTENADVFLVSGDLFDKEVHAENLRPKIREILSGNDFKILLLPGNHDAESYRQGYFFGEDSVILGEEPYTYHNVSFAGLPFEPIEEEVLIKRLHVLRDKMKDNEVNILAYHGELLDTFFSRKDFGEEGESRYMPARLSYFKDLNFDYVLAGHFHTNFDIRQIGEDQYFVYPGSPVSITRREQGRRKANLFSVGENPREYILDTPHYLQKEVKLDPFVEEKPLEHIQNCLKDIHHNAYLTLKVTGFINGMKSGLTETKLAEEIRRIAHNHRNVEIINESQDVQRILENDLFSAFLEKLDKADVSKEKNMELRELAIKAMMEAGL